MPSNDSKQCGRCRELKPLDEFWASKATKDGKQGLCKSCCRNHVRSWCADNPDRRREYSRRAYRKRNPDSKTFKQVVADKEAKALLSEKPCKKCGIVKPIEDFVPWSRTADGRTYQCRSCIAERARARYSKNPTKYMAPTKRWQQRNPGMVLQNGQRRRVRKRNIPGSHTLKQWRSLCRRFGNRCVCCGKCGDLTKDHIVPISNPNCSDDISNIQPLCYSCNSSKGNRNCIDYRRTPFTGRGQAVMFG